MKLLILLPVLKSVSDNSRANIVPTRARLKTARFLEINLIGIFCAVNACAIITHLAWKRRLNLFQNQDRITQHIHPRLHAQAGLIRRRQPTTLTLRRTFGDADGNVAVEIRGREQQFRWRAVR